MRFHMQNPPQEGTMKPGPSSLGGIEVMSLPISSVQLSPGHGLVVCALFVLDCIFSLLALHELKHQQSHESDSLFIDGATRAHPRDQRAFL